MNKNIKAKQQDEDKALTAKEQFENQVKTMNTPEGQSTMDALFNLTPEELAKSYNPKP